MSYFANQELQNTDKLIAKEKANDIERLSLFAAVELIQTSGSFELEDVFQHWITKECLSIYNVNETLKKSQKSKLIQHL